MQATHDGKRRWNGRRTWLIVIAVVLAVIVLGAFVSMRRSLVAVRVGHADRETITSAIATNAKLEALNNFEAHAPMGTTVKKIYVHQGDWVKPGQLLLQLSDADARLQASRAEAQIKGAEAEVSAVEHGGTKEEVLTTQNALVKAQADRDTAQRNLQAMQRLAQTGAASSGEVRAAQDQLKIAEANVHLLEQKLHSRYSQQEVGHAQARESEARASLAAAEQLLKDSNVVAPRAGMVYSLPVQEGAFVNTGDLLVQVADVHTLKLRAFIDEPDIGKLQAGQRIEVTWDAMPGRSWTCKLDALPTTIVQRGTRMVGETTCIIDNTDLRLLPNTNVSVAIITARQENAVTVPREAIHQDASGQYVFEVVKGELVRRNVTASVSNLTRVAVTGLSDNAVLALGAINMRSLSDGMAVKVVNP